MEKCNKCEYIVKGAVVPYHPYEADVMFIGDFPSMEDFENNSHLSKKSSRLKIDMYKNILDTIGPFSYYTTNYIKCFTNGVVFPQQYFHCKEHLLEEINIVKPKIIIFLGNKSGSLKFDTSGEFRPRYMYSEGVHYLLLQHPHQSTLKPKLFTGSIEFLKNILPQLKK